MVSFQCHGCGDVVKKPKLDQHRSRCFTGFDCIDCSKTFKSPAEYKGHTSCISEAEKYQKGLYKGPKTGADGVKSSNSPQPNSSLDKKDPTHTTVTRQSNAQWNRNTQPTSVDNVNGYPGPQNQHPQNGWQNGRDNHRYSDRGRKGSNRQQNRFTGSSASGANDTPLGVSRRSSVDDPVVVNGVAPTFEPGNRADDASQANPKAEISEAKGKPPKEKRKPKVVGSTDSSSSHTGKGIPAEPDIVKAEKNSEVVHNDGKKKRKEVVNGEANSETGSAEADTAGSEIKEKVKKGKGRREKTDEEQGLIDPDAASSGDKKKTKKVKRQKAAADEPNSIDEGDAGKKENKKEKKRKEVNADNGNKAKIMVAEGVEIPASVEEPTRTKKVEGKGTTDDATGYSETLVLENAAVEVMAADQTTKKKKKKKLIATDSISETATHAEKQKKEETRQVDEDMKVDAKVNAKEKKRKRREEPNDRTTEKRRKHTS